MIETFLTSSNVLKDLNVRREILVILLNMLQDQRLSIGEKEESCEYFWDVSEFATYWDVCSEVLEDHRDGLRHRDGFRPNISDWKGFVDSVNEKIARNFENSPSIRTSEKEQLVSEKDAYLDAELITDSILKIGKKS